MATAVRSEAEMTTPKPARELDADGFPVFREEGSRAVRWLLVYPLVGFLALWVGLYVESEILTYVNRDVLNAPRLVKSIDGNALILADGGRVPLPFLKRIPGDSFLFRSALERGVEVEANGDVFGLLSVRAICGMTLQHRSVQRINLSELAAVTLPACVDTKGFDPEEFKSLCEDSHFPSTMGSVSGHIHTYLRRWRTVFDAMEKAK